MSEDVRTAIVEELNRLYDDEFKVPEGAARTGPYSLSIVNPDAEETGDGYAVPVTTAPRTGNYAPVTGLTVSLLRGEEVVAQLTTTKRGQVLFRNIPAGAYRLRFADPNAAETSPASEA